MGFQIVSCVALGFETYDTSSGELMSVVFIYVLALYLVAFFCQYEPECSEERQARRSFVSHTRS